MPSRTFQTEQGILLVKRIANGIISASEDSKLRIWSLGDQRMGDLDLLRTWRGQKGASSSIATYENLMYTSSMRDCQLRTWDLKVLEKGPDFEGHTRPLTDVATDKHAGAPSVWTCSDDQTIKGWDGRTGSCECTLQGHTATVSAIKISGNYVVSSSLDKTVRLWDKRKLQPISVFKGHTGPVFGIYLQQEKKIFSCGIDGLFVWNFKNGRKSTCLQWGRTSYLFIPKREDVCNCSKATQILSQCTNSMMKTTCFLDLVIIQYDCGMLRAALRWLFTVDTNRKLLVFNFGEDGSTALVLIPP